MLEQLGNNSVILLSMLVFLGRIVDVTLGTLRTINIIYSRAKMAFVLGFLEVLIWVFVISTVFKHVLENPVIGVFYALGFACGNVVGIHIERKLSIGYVVLHVIAAEHGENMSQELRAQGYTVTTFIGQGNRGPVMELYVACKKRDLGKALAIVKRVDPEAFYLTDQVGSISKLIRPMSQEPTGWRAILKKK